MLNGRFSLRYLNSFVSQKSSVIDSRRRLMAYFHSLQFSRNFFIFFHYYYHFFFFLNKSIFTVSPPPFISWITVNGILNKIFNLSFPSVRQRWRVAPWNMRFFFFFVTERQALNSPWSTAITNRIIVFERLTSTCTCLSSFRVWNKLCDRRLQRKIIEKTYAFAFLRVEKRYETAIYKYITFREWNSTDRVDAIFIMWNLSKNNFSPLIILFHEK